MIWLMHGVAHTKRRCGRNTHQSGANNCSCVFQSARKHGQGQCGHYNGEFGLAAPSLLSSTDRGFYAVWGVRRSMVVPRRGEGLPTRRLALVSGACSASRGHRACGCCLVAVALGGQAWRCRRGCVGCRCGPRVRWSLVTCGLRCAGGSDGRMGGDCSQMGRQVGDMGHAGMSAGRQAAGAGLRWSTLAGGRGASGISVDRQRAGAHEGRATDLFLGGAVSCRRGRAIPPLEGVARGAASQRCAFQMGGVCPTSTWR